MTTPSEKSASEIAQELSDKATSEANEIITNALENHDEITASARESVSTAAEAVAGAAEEVSDLQKELEWKLTTQNQLAELTARIQALTETHSAIPAQLETMRAEMLTALTPPPPPPPENADALLDLENEPPTPPESTAENRPPPKQKRNWL